MKKIMYVCLVSLLMSAVQGQQSLPTRLKMGKGLDSTRLANFESLQFINYRQQRREIKKETDSGKKEQLRQEQSKVNEATKSSKEVFSFKDLTKWGIYGIGSVNTETLQDVNASGKVSGYIRLNRSDMNFTTAYFSFNKNATNSDSLLSGTFLFPDIGNTSFLLTLDHTAFWKKTGSTMHLFGMFFEISHKSIKAGADSDKKEFSTLNYILGAKYQNWSPSGDVDVSFSFSPYLALNNVPDEDNENYWSLFKVSKQASEVWSMGMKFTVQFNNLQAFANLRHVFGSADNIPSKQLRGFNSNVGVIFNAEVFEK